MILGTFRLFKRAFDDATGFSLEAVTLTSVSWRVPGAGRLHTANVPTNYHLRGLFSEGRLRHVVKIAQRTMEEESQCVE